MAKSEQYSLTVLRASDEVPDIYCEPCNQVGNVAIAEGYCVDCPEFLCGPCYKIHRGHKALANHVLLDKDSMPIASDPSRRVVDVCATKCPIHPNKVIELFCETCNKPVCHICVATDHRQCEKVKHIPDIVKDLEHTEEFKKFNEDIKSTALKLVKCEEKLQANVTSNKEMITFAKQELKRQREEVIRFFDQLEKNMDDQITALEKRNRHTLKAASDRLDHMKTDLDQIKNDMKSKYTGQTCELFISMKQSQEKMRTFDDQFNKMREELRLQHYALVPSEQIQAMMRTTTEICRIATARFESEIDIKTIIDKTQPSVQGLTIMHGHFCVASDDGNKSIKVIDTNSKCVTSEIATQAAYIMSVTSVSANHVAVLVSSTSSRLQIQLFTVSASGVIQRTNHLFSSYRYSGMVHCSGNIFGVRDRTVHKLDMTGEITTIHTEYKGLLEGIAASPDGQWLYVTDSKRPSVIRINLNGNVTAIYKDDNFMFPRGITVDKHGYVYVYGHYTSNILLQLTADLKKVQVLIEDRFSGIITYSSTENKLYISACNNQIHQYALDFK